MSLANIWVAVIILLTLLVAEGDTPVDGPECAADDSGACQPTLVVALPDPATAAEGWVPVETDGVYGVIIPAFDGDESIAWADDFWTPGIDDVRAAEAALLLDQGPLDQFRQYVGIVTNGQEKLWINGFCDALDHNWYQAPIFVLDGGDCFFNGIYDVETNTIEKFSFNGDA